MRSLTTTFIVVGIATLLSLPASAQDPSTGSGQIIATKTLDRFYDPIEIRGEMFPLMHNLKLDHLALLVCQNGKLVPIPYQFDEWTPEGEMILRSGADHNTDKANDILDPQDMLVFMARDLGDRVEPAIWKDQGTRGVEIEVIEPLTQERAWAYLVYFEKEIPKAARKYTLRVDTDTPEFRNYGDTYTMFGTSRELGGKHYRTVVNKFIAVNPEAGGTGLNFIDRSKYRVSFSLFFGLIKIKFNEDNFIGGMDRYFVGPVRASGRQWVSLVLPMNLKTPKIYGDIYVYDTMILTIGHTSFPFNPGYVLTNYKMSVGYDLHDPNGRGMQYYSDTNPGGFLMDGHMSEDELSNYNDEPDNWRCIVGPQGWMIHRSIWDEDYRQQARIRMKYRDDIEHQAPPDYFPGDLGFYYTESTIESLDPGTYRFQLDWYWPYHFYTPDGPDMKTITAICNMRDNPLVIKAGDRQAVNTGVVMTSLMP